MLDARRIFSLFSSSCNCDSFKNLDLFHRSLLFQSALPLNSPYSNSRDVHQQSSSDLSTSQAFRSSHETALLESRTTNSPDCTSRTAISTPADTNDQLELVEYFPPDLVPSNLSVKDSITYEQAQDMEQQIYAEDISLRSDWQRHERDSEVLTPEMQEESKVLTCFHDCLNVVLLSGSLSQRFIL